MFASRRRKQQQYQARQAQIAAIREMKRREAKS